MLFCLIFQVALDSSRRQTHAPDRFFLCPVLWKFLEGDTVVQTADIVVCIEAETAYVITVKSHMQSTIDQIEDVVSHTHHVKPAETTLEKGESFFYFKH